MFSRFKKIIVLRMARAFAMLAAILATTLVQAAPSVDFFIAKSMGADRVSAIAIDENKNIYTTGDFYGSTDFDPGPGMYTLVPAGSRDIFVSKFDSQGSFLWAKKMGGTDVDFSLAMLLDPNGNVYTTGHFTGTADFDPGPGTYNLSSAGENDIFVSKLDADGNFVWAQKMGSTLGDFGISIGIDANANVYTTGFFSDTVDFDPGPGLYNLTSSGNFDIFISKLDTNGNFVWAKRMGGISDDRGRGIVLDGNGNIFHTGIFSGTVDFDPGAATYTLTSNGMRQQYISKLDGNGSFLWAKSNGSSEDHVSINVDRKGNVYTTGEFSGTADFDPGVGTNNLSSAGANDNFVIKLDADGNFVWARNFGSSYEFDYSEDIALDASGNIYITGSYAGTADFDPGLGTYIQTAQGRAPAHDIFISKLNSRGNFVWAKSMGGANTDSGFAILSHEGNIYTAGNFEGTSDFDPGPGVSTLTSTGGLDTFVSNLYETAIRHVKWDATGGANNGTSWEDAYTDLQSALSVANKGDEIWVAEGTYKPTTGTDRSISFVLKNGVAIYGGFAGTETLRSERNAATHVTILSGNLGEADNVSDNSYHVIKSSSLDNTTILDGFTVTAGNASDQSSLTGSGGGMYNEVNSTPQLINVIFLDNLAVIGAGMFNDSSNPVLTNVTFDSNISGSGGGMFNVQSSPTLVNVTFSANIGTETSRGGAMVNDQNSSPHLTNVTFVGNRVTYTGGAMLNADNSNPILENVTFYDNTSMDRGGAIYNWASSPVLKNVTFSGNNAPAGGAIYNDNNSNPTIVNTILYGDGGEEIYNYSGTATVTYSIVQGGYAGTGNKNVNPLLGPLEDNGGFTRTMALLPGSPAIDAGYDGNCPDTDQRGMSRPQGAHCDIGAYETVSSTFTDVPFDHWAWRYIEGLYKAGVTSGCGSSPMLYCPGTTVTRDQMAVFLLRAKHGSNYSPPAATGVFQDVPTNHWAAPWIERLAAEGITGGCSVSPKLYCPTTAITRDQMAIFLLRAKHGSSYGPPTPTGVFQDVPTNYWAAAWIEQLATEGITGGCSTSPMRYCPTTPVSRDQMAVFLVRTFNLP